MTYREEVFDLYQEIREKTPGGEVLRQCLQCGTCSGSCPSASEMDHTPRRIFALLDRGDFEEVLRSNTPWYCLSCYACTVRCPKNIPITDIMYSLKRMAGIYAHKKIDRNARDWSQDFMAMVKTFGRNYEAGLAVRYHATHQPLKKMGLSTFALQMLTRSRLNLMPDRIKNRRQLRAILDAAERLEGA